MTCRLPLLQPGLALLFAVLALFSPHARADAPTVLDQPSADAPIEATDPDNCLLCHRFPGLSRLDAETGDVRLFFVSERFHADGAGPHTSLACTACHTKDAVEKIPHGDVKPVDCGQACHLVTGSGSPVEFSHKVPTESLAKSVHNPETLQAQPYEAALLRDGQSACLYCHDDPTYRMPEVTDTFHRGMDPTVRCQTCHDDSLPVDTTRALRHVGSRMGDQRPARESARTCAVCHSDEAINEKNELHDAVTSYMRSFHGKASSLGMLNAPVCTDCHSGEGENPHLMLSADDPASPTSPDNRQLTCRSLGCHDNAAPDLSAAGVHMRVSPEAKTVEYYVTVAFVILTAGTMTLYFVLLVLELINIVIRRPDDEHLQLVELARLVQSNPVGRKRLARLNVHQRFQHWVLVIAFITLVITGLPMKFAKVDWMPLLVQLLGGLQSARDAHRIAAVTISVAFVYHLGYLAVLGWRDLARRRQANPERGLLAHLAWMVWDYPMMIQPRDIKDFLFLFLWLFGLRKHRPAQGRFHFSQKFEYWAVFWGMTMIGFSGAMLWLEDRAAETLGGRALNFAYIVHSDEAFLALLYISVVHFFAVVFSPAVFPLNLGSLTGDMPPTELAENHLGYLKSVAKDLGIEPPPVVVEPGFWPRLRALGLRGYALVQAGIVAWAGFVVLTFLVGELRGPERAVAIEQLPLRLDEAVLDAPTDVQSTGAGAAARDALDRGPLAHFHAIPTWYEPDTSNTCTGGGCHAPLPHGEHKEVRAFLNMHTSFVDCQVCHRDSDLRGSSLAWVSLDDRSVREAPAVIRLQAMLDDVPPVAVRPADWHTRLTALLDEAVADSGQDPELVAWQNGLESSRVGGVRYEAVLAEARARVGLHGHGEYGAKIGLTPDSGLRWAPDAAAQDAITRLRGPDTLRVDERKTLVKTAHQALKKPQVECQLCHTDQDGLVDFRSLGYSPARAGALRSNSIARQAQAVEEGQTFFLPDFLGLGATDTPPTPTDSPAPATPQEVTP